MFVHCNKNLHIREGTEELNLQRGFIGAIDDRWAKHWFIQAAISDGTIETADAGEKPAKKPSKKTDKSFEETADTGEKDTSADGATE